MESSQEGLRYFLGYLGGRPARKRDPRSGHGPVSAGAAAERRAQLPDEPARIDAAVVETERQVQLRAVGARRQRPTEALQAHQLLRHLGNDLRNVDLAHVDDDALALAVQPRALVGPVIGGEIPRR